ncbi:MAG: sugar phosphate isomerase/epimerase family protein [Oscillospiraceae bacterium]
MYSISTYPLKGKKLIEFSDELKRSKLDNVGFELFYDNIPFHKAKAFKRFLNGIRLGMHCPMEGCCLLAPKGSLDLKYTLEKHRECFSLAQKLGAEYVVIHTNSLAPRSAEEIAEQRMILPKRMEMIAEAADEYSLKIAVENVGFRFNNSLVAEYDDFVSLAKTSDLNFLVDIGHANANDWDIPALINTLGERILGFHFHDNDGASDSHSPIESGTADWNGIFDAIKKSAPNADRTIEYSSAYTDDIIFGIRLIRSRLGTGKEPT